MNLLCRTTVSRFGNSRAVIIPKNVSDFPVKSKIDLYETAQGILIKPVVEWSAQLQTGIINDIISFVSSHDDNEPLPYNFAQEYCSDDNSDDDLDFNELREDV